MFLAKKSSIFTSVVKAKLEKADIVLDVLKTGIKELYKQGVKICL